jgi:hypothetical protein
VQDGNLITAGGVTAGIHFGLALVAELLGPPRGGGDPAVPRICAGTAVPFRHAQRSLAGGAVAGEGAPSRIARGAPGNRRPHLQRRGIGIGPRETSICNHGRIARASDRS